MRARTDRTVSQGLMALALLGGQLVVGCGGGGQKEETAPTTSAPTVTPPAATKPKHHPLVWIHGCAPPGDNNEKISHLSDGQREYFKQNGYTDDELFRFVSNGKQCESTTDMAKEIAAYIDEVKSKTGADKVDVVAHSMGALAVRLYIKEGGDKSLHAFVSIAGAHHGMVMAPEKEMKKTVAAIEKQFGKGPFEGLKEMYPAYACKGKALGGAADVQFELNGCLTKKGRDKEIDETPAEPGCSYLSIRNKQDGIVVPVESACLNQKFQNDCSDPVNAEVDVPGGPCGEDKPCPGHVTMMFDQTVTKMVYDHIAREEGITTAAL